MKRAARRLLHPVNLLGMMGGEGVSWWLRVEFSTDDAAPLANPYVGEVGSIIPVQVDGQLSVVSASGLAIPAQATPVDGDLGWYASVPVARVAGRTLFTRFTPSTLAVYPSVGFSTAASVNMSTNGGECNLRIQNPYAVLAGNTVNLPYSAALGVITNVAQTLFDTGAAIFIQDGTLTSWSLVWINYAGSTATLYPAMSGFSGVAIERFARGRDLPAPFTSLAALATVFDTTLASNDTFTGTANAINDFEFTLPGSPSANDEISLYYRGDDTNGWKVFAKRNAGNTAWDLRVRTVSASVESTPAGWTDVTGIGTVTIIRAITNGTTHAFYTANGATWTKRGATLTVSHQDSATGMKIIAAAGTTLTRVASFPFSSDVYTSELSKAA